jgi:sugar phosphate isomerase/epimerase
MDAAIDRRAFVQRATLGTAALAFWRPSAAQAQSSMFISLPPWAVARNVGWPEQARLAARVGYAGIDWAFGAARKAGLEETRALFAEIKIRPTIVNLPMQSPLGPDEAAFKAQLPKLQEDAAFSAAIGGRNFQLVLSPQTGGSTKEERWKLVRDRLSAISEILAKSEMRLGLEFLGPLVFRTRGTSPVPFVWTLPETVKLCTACGPNIGVTLDAWHWFHSGGTVADIVATPASRIIHVHVSDAKPMPPEEVLDTMRWLPGEGIIDLMGFFKALKQVGYTGGVAPETIGPRIPDTMAPEESARLALEATTAVMKKAGVL